MPLNGNSLVKDEKTGFLTPSKNYSATGFTAEMKSSILELLRQKLNPGAACKALGISRGHFYLIMEQDLEFKRAYDEVKQAHLDDIAENMYDRAKKPNGTLAGIFLLRTQRPKEYGDVTTVVHETKSDEDQLFSRLIEKGKMVEVKENESANLDDPTQIIPKNLQPNPTFHGKIIDNE